MTAARFAGDPHRAIEELAACDDPWLIPVRHHSPACAAAMPQLLDRIRPDRILLELPPEFSEWLQWLGHPELEAPVALAAVGGDGEDLVFYPFADFSPELAAVRWAGDHGVPVEGFDRPLSARGPRRHEQEVDQGLSGRRGIVPALLEVVGADHTESLWDQLVEARASGSSVEALRRASLLVGWALRLEAETRRGVPEEDLAREAYMQSRLSAARARGGTLAAVVGAFHAPALLRHDAAGVPDAPALPGHDAAAMPDACDRVTSLIPYSFELLDSRSGYPAGIRDPSWQQSAWRALSGELDLVQVHADCLARIGRHIRGSGHASGVPDAAEALRMAVDLAALRGLPAPGRRELLEAVGSAFAQGELLGRGRVVARALQQTLVGTRRGKLPRQAPRSGLLPHVERLLSGLRMPGPSKESREPVELRLDPLRSKLDQQRHVTLMRLSACAVPYAELLDSTGIGGADTLTLRWRVQWTPATEAMLELAGMRGVTLAQAARGALLAAEKRLADDDRLDATARLEGLERAAECGIVDLVDIRVRYLVGPFLEEARLPQLIGAVALLDRIARGHVPGLPAAAYTLPADGLAARVLEAAVRAVEALAGSTLEEDARALLELTRLVTREMLGDGRLAWALVDMARSGSPLMQGAASAAAVLIGRAEARALGLEMAGWLDSATNAAGREALRERLVGALIVGAPLVEAEPSVCGELMERVEALDDAEFLARLSALRGGFDRLSAASRQRLLDVLAERLGELDIAGRGLDVVLEDAPEALAACARADLAARRALEALDADLLPGLGDDGASPPIAAPQRIARDPDASHAVSARDRWRLILGRERERLAPGCARVARALDELYGDGHGEGSRQAGGGGGKEHAYPSVREWSEELVELFGKDVREEVLAKAAASVPAALLELDPEGVSPSVELLERVLSLKGGMGEAQLHHLRRIADRIVAALVEALAIRVRPALSGLTTPRPTLRPTGRPDLGRTIRRNLRTVRAGDDGRPELVPERIVFKSRAKRSMDWRIVLVVDVSGSMEASVIYSAMMAAIFHALPAVSAHFLAFSTEVLDFSGRVDDPLGLLMEIQVGGGTHIAKALRYARQLVTVPSRTLLLLVSDFEEGYPVGNLLAEVRALVESGVKPLGIAALDDRGAPRYSRAIAELVAASGMPVAALTPLELARWVGEQIA